MRSLILIGGCALSLIGSAAWSIPPSEPVRNYKTYRTNPSNFPGGTPSMSPYGAQSRSPGLPMGASGNAVTPRQYPGSIVGGSSNYYGQLPNRPYPGYRPDYRPDYRPGHRPPGRPNYGDPYDRYPTCVPYYWQLHQHWRPSVWTRPYRPAYYNYGYITTGSGLTIGGGSIAYANPFYSTPGQYGFDYSQPLQLPGPSYQETNEDLILSERAIQRFDLARERFALGDYNGAAKYVDEAIRWLPNDPTLHQFRALTFFARKRYREAAAVLYSVLAVSPGWDTATVTNLYDTPERYLMQVNQLAQYASTHPDAIETQFLLAYHYAIAGDLAAAYRQLQIVNAARPNDRVVKSLMSAIR